MVAKLFWNEKAKPKTYFVHFNFRMTKKYIGNHIVYTKEWGVLLDLEKVKEQDARKTRPQKRIKEKRKKSIKHF